MVRILYALGGYFANDILQVFNNFFGKTDNSGVGVPSSKPKGFNFMTLVFVVVGYLIFREFNK